MKEQKTTLSKSLELFLKDTQTKINPDKGFDFNRYNLLFEDFRKAILDEPSMMEKLLSDTARGEIEVKIKGKDGVSKSPVISLYPASVIGSLSINISHHLIYDIIPKNSKREV